MMKPNSWKKKAGTMALCGALAVALHAAVQPVPSAEAAVVGSILGTVIQGAAAHQQVNEMIKHYDQTEEGRQELFAAYKKKYGVSENSTYFLDRASFSSGCS